MRAREATVFRINFCAGDWLHWHGAGCHSFKGRPDEWSSFVGRFLDTHGITDLVLHGDQRLYHRMAISEARSRGLQVAVTELGALRPGWMTLERNGLSTVSHFPDDPERIREIARTAAPVDMSPKFPSSFWLQTGPDVIYNLTNVALAFLYPHYQRHTIYPPVIEYARGAARLMRQKTRDEAAEAEMRRLIDAGTRYFILPLQLEGDFQLRRHSPYKSFADVLELVFASFADHAPAATHLVLKSHPLDVGFENWPQVTEDIARRLGIAERVHFLDGGGLALPFGKAAGVVTLNSTAGLEAMQEGLPVKTLVPAHYDIAGLTDQASLADFWTAPRGPDTKLLADYVKALAVTTQVRGSIHNAEGVDAAAENMAERILARSLNEPGGFIDPPPRLARARALGIPL